MRSRILIFIFLPFLCSAQWWNPFSENTEDSEKIKFFLNNYYKSTESNNYIELNAYYERYLVRWYDSSHVKLDNIVSATEDYFNRYPFQKNEIQWENFTYTKIDDNNNYKINYTINHSFKKRKSDDWELTNSDIEIILGSRFKMTSIIANPKFYTKKEYFSSNFSKRLKTKRNAKYYRVISYDANTGNPIGITKDYYITGELQWEGKFVKIDKEDDSKNIMDGTARFYHKNGQLLKELYYNYGKLKDGVYKSFHDNGKIKSEYTSKNNKKEGIYKSWHDNGKKEYVSNYKDGKREGNLKRYDRYGNLEWDLNFKNDKEHGRWRTYKDGELVLDTEFNDGEQITQNNSSNYRSTNYSNSTTTITTKECRDCRGTGSCKECNDSRNPNSWSMGYVKYGGWKSEKYNRPGRIPCSTCRGNGRIDEKVDAFKKYTYRSCYVSACSSGEIKCKNYRCENGRCTTCDGLGRK